MALITTEELESLKEVMSWELVADELNARHSRIVDKEKHNAVAAYINKQPRLLTRIFSPVWRLLCFLQWPILIVLIVGALIYGISKNNSYIEATRVKELNACSSGNYLGCVQALQAEHDSTDSGSNTETYLLKVAWHQKTGNYIHDPGD